MTEGAAELFTEGARARPSPSLPQVMLPHPRGRGKSHPVSPVPVIAQDGESGGRETNFRKVERKSELFEDLQIQLANEKENSFSLSHQLSLLKIENENLTKQRDSSAQEIERLQKELDEARAKINKKDEQLEEMTARVLTMAENQQELLRNTQLLQAQAQQKRGFFARLFAPKDKNDTV